MGSSRQRYGAYNNAVTEGPTAGRNFVAPVRASDGRECIVSMPFWVVAVLSAMGVLAMVCVMYLLSRRWL
jgi:hypothetical protein